jgi:hypothetical protein
VYVYDYVPHQANIGCPGFSINNRPPFRFVYANAFVTTNKRVGASPTVFSATKKMFSGAEKIFSMTEKIFSKTEKIF